MKQRSYIYATRTDDLVVCALVRLQMENSRYKSFRDRVHSLSYSVLARNSPLIAVCDASRSADVLESLANRGIEANAQDRPTWIWQEPGNYSGVAFASVLVLQAGIISWSNDPVLLVFVVPQLLIFLLYAWPKPLVRNTSDVRCELFGVAVDKTASKFLIWNEGETWLVRKQVGYKRKLSLEGHNGYLQIGGKRTEFRYDDESAQMLAARGDDGNDDAEVQ